MIEKVSKKFEISLSKAKSIILKPIVTEKSTMLSQYNQIEFKVARNANAREIKSAIEKLFKVKVKKVNTLISRGKIKSFRGQIGKRSDIKKAIVTLEQDNSIDISAGI
ncbi:MAG: 50S ribosomal protein L23 [Pelagibacteraceae bacterium]|nr:50S ribosomal protein L23 [Pelagibacteraceae bacterium]PPR51768.1 MAG: 50S ribosomal protein L23 [Alphaproteobacteria bacterium MarineAlpha5_Bin10]|tara:strand:- start:1355 stop:1678 length:324 start_codon:yes stop_codon:yes gene_type:complete